MQSILLFRLRIARSRIRYYFSERKMGTDPCIVILREVTEECRGRLMDPSLAPSLALRASAQDDRRRKAQDDRRRKAQDDEKECLKMITYHCHSEGAQATEESRGWWILRLRLRMTEEEKLRMTEEEKLRMTRKVEE